MPRAPDSAATRRPAALADGSGARPWPGPSPATLGSEPRGCAAWTPIAPAHPEMQRNRNAIPAPREGVVSEIPVTAGQNVQAGDTLVELD